MDKKKVKRETAALAAVEATVDARERIVAAQEKAALAAVEATVDARERIVAAQEKDLSARCDQINRRQRQQDDREVGLVKREAAIQKPKEGAEVALEARLKEADEREQRQNARSGELDKRETELRKREDALKEHADVLRLGEGLLAGKRAEAEAEMKAWNELREKWPRRGW